MKSFLQFGAFKPQTMVFHPKIFIISKDCHIISFINGSNNVQSLHLLEQDTEICKIKGAKLVYLRSQSMPDGLLLHIVCSITRNLQEQWIRVSFSMSFPLASFECKEIDFDKESLRQNQIIAQRPISAEQLSDRQTN